MGSYASDLKKKYPNPGNEVCQLQQNDEISESEVKVAEEFEDISHSDLGGILNPQILKDNLNALNDQLEVSSNEQIEDDEDPPESKPSSYQDLAYAPPTREPFISRKPSTVVPLPKIVPSPTHTECDLVSTKVTPRHNFLQKPPSLVFPDFSDSFNSDNKLSPTFSPSEVRITTASHNRNLSDLKLEELS